MQQPGEIVDEQVPFGAAIGKLAPRPAEPFGKRRPRDQPLDAIAVERACAGKIVTARAPHAHMPGLAMRGALHRPPARNQPDADRSEEHTSELQSLMRISYAVFCLTNKKKQK